MVVSAIQCGEVAPASGPYAAGVRVSIPGADVLFVSGQVSEAAGQSCVAPGDAAGQTEQVLKNMVAVLEAGGASITDVAKVTVFLRNMEDRDTVADVRRRFFGEHLTASTLVEVSKLAHPDWLIEVEAIAVVERRDSGPGPRA